MLIQDFRKKINEELADLYPKTEIDAFFFILMEFFLNKKRIDILLHSDENISIEIQEKLNETLSRLKKEEPIQYILGETEFYGYRFKVDQNTLIPRPETEELVAWIIETISSDVSLKNKSIIKVLDIGTGSGCIPITLAKELENISIDAIDVSENALTVAKENAALHNVTVNFIHQNILNSNALSQDYDIIISNPPYVRDLEKKEMNNNVLANEPHLALFVPDENPFVFYKKIAELSKTALSTKGLLFFEINQYLGSDLVHVMQQMGYNNVMLRKDFRNNNRMLRLSMDKRKALPFH